LAVFLDASASAFTAFSFAFAAFCSAFASALASLVEAVDAPVVEDAPVWVAANAEVANAVRQLTSR
jgi:hypothetical protein